MIKAISFVSELYHLVAYQMYAAGNLHDRSDLADDNRVIERSEECFIAHLHKIFVVNAIRSGI